MPHKDPEARKKWREDYREKNKIAIRSKEKEYYHTVHKFKTHVKEQQANHRRSIQNRFMRAKKKAEYKTVAWNLSLEDFKQEIEKPCFYCQNKLCKPSEVGVGLDQIVPGNGYIVGNVVSCCYTCNRIKGDEFSSEETLAAVQAVIALKESKANGKT